MTTQPQALVILTPGFPSDEGDTACLPAQQVFVRALNRNYPAVKVILLSFEYPHRRDRYRWFGNPVIAVGGWKDGWANKAKTIAIVWRTLGELRREYEVLGLLSFWCGGCALVGKYFGLWRKLPHFIWILGQDARQGNQFVPLIRPGGKDLIAMSNFLAAEFKRNYKVTPGHIIFNGVETELFPMLPAVRDIDVLGVGSLIPLKQYDLFVSIIHGASIGLPGIRSVICGKGPGEAGLREQIRRLGPDAHVKLVGERPHREAIALMQRAKILLHTSGYEGFSTVCLEALYAGAQVISFTDPLGYPVEHWHVVKDTAEAEAKLLELLHDQAVTYGRVMVHRMDDSVNEIMALYGYPADRQPSEAAIS